MNMRIFAITIIAALGIGACSAQPESLQEVKETFEDPPPPVELVISTTPAMLSAALTGDPDTMRAAAVLEASGSCVPASTCPGFGSCTAWSSFNICDEVCGESCGLANFTYQTRDSFRVCFNAARQACTEWRQSRARFCDC